MESQNKRSTLIGWLLFIQLYINRQADGFIKTCDQIYASIARGSEPEVAYRKLRFPRCLRWYQNFTSYYLTIMIIKLIFPLDSLVEIIWHPSLPAHCYIPGRFIIYNNLADQKEIKQMAKKVGLIFAVWHLSWRLTHMNTRVDQNILMFMIQDREKIVKVYNSVIQEPNYDSLRTPLDYYLLKVMCYPVWNSNKYLVKYQVRANRQPDAYDILTSEIIFASLASLILFFVLLITIYPLIIWSSLGDKNYLTLYPNCDPQLQRDLEAGCLGRWTITLNFHHLLVLVFDIIENTILWCDTGLLVTITLASAYVSNHDILIAWHRLHNKLVKLNQTYKMEWLRAKEQEVELLDHHSLSQQFNESVNTLKWNNYISPYHIKRRRFKELSQRRRKSEELEDRTLKIQTEICDFFLQIRLLDTQLMSQVITYCVVIWFFVFMVFTQHITVLKDIHPYIPFLIGFGFVMLTILSQHLILLDRYTKRSYVVICSMMALDRTKYRVKFLGILDFYRRGLAFTLFRQWPYTSSSYLTIISWTISIVFISDGLWGKRSTTIK